MQNTAHALIRRRRTLCGFTLIELLVVVLILSILMAVAMPLYLSAISDAQRKTCRANLQTIANAVQSARVRTNAIDYGALIAGGVTIANLPDLYNVALCPSGGVYTLSDGSSGTDSTFKVSCSVAAHGTFEPGVDSN
jgi:type IV pilus assembly protein PilA